MKTGSRSEPVDAFDAYSRTPQCGFDPYCLGIIKRLLLYQPFSLFQFLQVGENGPGAPLIESASYLACVLKSLTLISTHCSAPKVVPRSPFPFV